jgi:hypothetical protein
MAEKPITVTTDETISSFADNRQGRLAVFMRRPNSIARSDLSGCARIIAFGLSGDKAGPIS